MARTRNPAVHAVRRDEILDVAERLIRTRGYERMSVQDVQDELGVSRGAIYHYFDSKQAMLEAVIARMTEAGMTVIEPIAADPDRSAPEKLQAVFAAGGAWKTGRSDLLLALMRSWYSADNDVVRMRASRAAAQRFTPLLAGIVHQGVAEGAFDVASPDHAAVIVMALLTGSGDAIGQLLIDRRDGLVAFDHVQQFVAAYEEALERILGLAPGSFVLMDSETLNVWYA